MNANPSITINGRRISSDTHPYIIAELSANHNGSLDTALRIVECAHRAGADAVKLQTYTADTITLNCNNSEFMITEGLWAGRSLHDLYSEASMPWEWHIPLFELAKRIGITIFSSPFDSNAVDFLESLDAPAYKIASFESIDIPLIKYVASTGKPMIISTGMANKEEISEAVDAAYAGGCKELALLHCVSGYPAMPQDYNLSTLVDMKCNYRVITGLSDHTLCNTTAITSIGLGACIIEKHVTLDRNSGGPDDSFSLVPSELEALCSQTKVAWESVGCVDYGLKSSEKGNIKFRRSLYFVNSIQKGTVLSANDIRSVRPGYGIPPKFLDSIIGRTVSRDIIANEPVRWSDFQD